MDREVDRMSDERVVDAYRRFRAADVAMHERVREATAMSENEVRMIQFLIDAEADGRQVKPSDLTRHIGVSSASTTALLDRLERAGCLERIAHPTDRRSILITVTATGYDRVTSTIGAFDARLHELSAALTVDARDAIVDFFDSLADAADDVASPALSQSDHRTAH